MPVEVVLVYVFVYDVGAEADSHVVGPGRVGYELRLASGQPMGHVWSEQGYVGNDVGVLG